MSLSLRRLLPIALALGGVACPDFQPDPPAGPTPLAPGRYATVRIEYRQLSACANAPDQCGNPVVFFGSWMKGNDAPVILTATPGTYQWTGVALGVPVNWPPVDSPHAVRVYDPHLASTPNGGVTAVRLLVGGQVIYSIEDQGTPQEEGLIYIDDNGVGRNPF